MAERWTEAQKAAITEKGRNIIVSAAAGSGKTSVLSERVCRFVADGGDIERLLVVTFTKAASKEMRSRIRRKIADLCRGETDAAVKARLRRQLVKVGNARISTIDSFFGDLVRENFRVVGVSPNFGMADATETAAAEQEALEKVISRAFEEMSDDFKTLIDLVGGDIRNEKIPLDVKYISSKLATVPFRSEWLEEKKKLYSDPAYFTSFCCSYIADRIGEVLPSFEELLDSGLIGGQNNASALNEVVFKLRSALDAAEKGDWDGARTLEFECRLTRRTKDDDVAAFDRFKQLRKKVRDKSSGNGLFDLPLLMHSTAAVAKELEVMRRPVSCLFDLVEAYSEELRRICAEKNKYTFDMITEAALRLLVKNYDHNSGAFEPTDLARAVAADFDGVMIDEYQDTSPVQDLCFAAVGRDDMFVVGDLKQAIYAFRGTSPECFAKKRDVFYRIDLNRNFRSRKGILDFANFLFSMLLSEKVGGVEYDDGEWLNHGEKAEPEQARPSPDVEFDVLREDYENSLLESDALKPYASHAARRILGLVEKGDCGRKYEFSDIAVLCLSNGQCEQIQRACRALGVPSFFEKGSDLFESKTVGAVVRVLRALNNPYSDIDLYACMTCGIFDVRESDVAQAVAAFGKGGYLYDKISAFAENSDRIDAFLSSFRALRALSFELPLSSLVRRIYDATGCAEKVLLLPRGEERHEDLMSFEAFTLGHEQACDGSLSRFLKLIDDFIASGEKNEPVSAPKGDFVRVMTVHGSKGLEFPVCILPNLEKDFTKTKPVSHNVLFSSRFAVGTKLRDEEGTVEAPSFLYSLNKLLDRNEKVSEELRVFYVAVTRAKEKLILCASAEALKPDEYAYFYNYTAAPDGPKKLKCLRLAVETCKSFAAFASLAMTHRPDSGFFNCADVPALTPDEPVRVNVFKSADAKAEDAEPDGETPPEMPDGGQVCMCGVPKQELDRRFGASLSTVLSRVPAKISVTELTKGFIADENAEPLFPLREKPSVTPEFLAPSKMSGAERGTAVHRFVSLLDLKADPSDELARLVSEGVLSEREAEAVNLEKIRRFLSSDIGELMRNAKKVYREESFVVRIPATEYAADADPKAEILLQGAVDALCETDDGFVLIDYKTDRKTAEELKALYSRQLGYYAYAVEKLFGKPVKKAYIRSFSLDETIEIPLH